MIRLAGLILLLLALMLSPLRAQPAGADLLASSAFDDVRRGVETLATSGTPEAATILGALGEGRLFVRCVENFGLGELGCQIDLLERLNDFLGTGRLRIAK